MSPSTFPSLAMSAMKGVHCTCMIELVKCPGKLISSYVMLVLHTQAYHFRLLFLPGSWYPIMVRFWQAAQAISPHDAFQRQGPIRGIAQRHDIAS